MEEAASEDKSEEAFAPREATMRAALEPVAEAISAFPGVLEAALCWRMGACDGIVRASSVANQMNSVADATLSAFTRELEFLDRPSDGDSAFALDAREVRVIADGESGNGTSAVSAFARVGRTPAAEIRLLVLAHKAVNDAAVRAVAELGWRAAVCAIAAEERHQALAFWRKRAIDAAGESSRARADMAAISAELAQQRAATAKLALRMFNAVDEESARIARDLHDEQAQLIAAAQIALETGGAEARAIFRRASDELRRTIRGLKAAALGERSLARALRAEFKLMADAGIKGKLTLGPGAKRLSRGARQLCWQVAREALSNVIRHSHASRVEVAISRRRGSAVISIADDGRGIPSKIGQTGGLGGLSERLRMTGGNLAIESAPGATRIVAEIPELK